jgi:hypothetical protein
MSAFGKVYLETVIKRFVYYKELADKTFAQLDDKDFYFQPNNASNSIAVIIHHMSGNMLSRWTNFLTEDGEKEWRNRDAEFENIPATSREALLERWNQGWDCMFNSLRSLSPDDLLNTVYIRHEPHTVTDAINRQLAHYPYHVGQIVYLGRLIKDEGWRSLSIPKGQSDAFNQEMHGKSQADGPLARPE